MNNNAIEVVGLGKQYRIRSGIVRKDQVPAHNGWQKAIQPIAGPLLRRQSHYEDVWAIEDVSFHVKHGEAIGIIGHNGAGKSTLLKILSRITTPTTGEVHLRGRVGALLEVGTGFHPELTGRENLYLSGAILGLRRAEIDRKFDEIVAFAGVERYLNTPVKRYSSGMYVRLAFAVAAHLEPDILLVDEVLAVGDAAFQKKCLGKMEDVALAGRTVLFVSHNMVAVQNLCTRALWLQSGKLMAQGPTSEIVPQYLSSSYSARTERVWDNSASAPGNEWVRLERASIRVPDAEGDAPIAMHRPLDVEIRFWNLVPEARLHLCLHVLNEDQIVAFTTSSNETDIATRDQPLPAGLYKSICRIPENLLNAGLHRILLLVLINGQKIVFRYENALSFEVLELEERPGAWLGKEPGAVRPKLQWSTDFLVAPAA